MTVEHLGWDEPETRLFENGSSASHRWIDDELAHAFARCFSSDDGKRVLQHLRALTLERVVAPSAPNAVLRHVEGQRQLVAYIGALVARG